MSDRNRAIDALIAEHAMGWKWYVHHDAPGKFLAPIEGRRPWWDLADGDEHVCQSRGPDIPRYSTDPAASKQLRDKMRELGWYFYLSSETHGATCEWFYPAPDMTLAGLRQAKVISPVKADTEELAVALSVCAALGIEAPK